MSQLAQNFDPEWAKHLKHDPDRPLAIHEKVPDTTWEGCWAIYKAGNPDGPEPLEHDEERRPTLKGQEYGQVSKSWIKITVQIYGSDESMTMSAQTGTTVQEVAERIAFKCGMDPFGLEFMVKQGCNTRMMYFYDQVNRKMMVKGIRSFSREKMQYWDPKVIIGAGHLGIRMAMFLVERKEFNFVVVDRMDRVGGTSWMYQANSTSKLQTEYGAYHLGYGEKYPLPTDFTTPWPSRNALLNHFQKTAREEGIMAYTKLNTNVKNMEIHSKGKDFPGPPSLRTEHYELTTEKMTAGRLSLGKVVARQVEDEIEEEVFNAYSVCMFPGNLTLPRMEEYKGEDIFDGDIGYAMFNEIDYHKLEGLNVTIVGHGAFAVENIRTCCEFGVHQIFLVCRRKNLACPRVCSWMANRTFMPLNNARYMKASEIMYNMIKVDPWSYYSVHANEKRTTCQITQKARFGIGDIYFLCIYMGKVEVVVDVGGVKRLTRHEVHLCGGRRLPCQGLLKLLGLVGEMDIDRLMRVKEMHGFWVNGDARRYLVAEPVSVMCSQMGGTSFAPGAYSWSLHGLYFLDFPWDFDFGPGSSGMLPKHAVDMSDDGTPRPAYVVDARHGTTTGMTIGMYTPGLGQYEASSGFIKAVRFRLCHPIRKFLAQAAEDWDYYAKKFLQEGFGADKPYPTYPYNCENVVEQYKLHMSEANEPALPCDEADLKMAMALTN